LYCATAPKLSFKTLTRSKSATKMASYSMLRRVSLSVIPLATRAVGSPRAFRGVVSGASIAKKAHVLGQRNFVPTLRFSSASAEKNLIQVLESEIKCAEDTPNETKILTFSSIALPVSFLCVSSLLFANSVYVIPFSL
jgi:hypothetical protein